MPGLVLEVPQLPFTGASRLILIGTCKVFRSVKKDKSNFSEATLLVHGKAGPQTQTAWS